MTIPTADSGTEKIAGGLQTARGQMEQMINNATKIRDEFEAQGWGGLDVLTAIPGKLKGVSDTLDDVATKIGVGGQTVRDAHLNNQMITNATKASLTDS